MRFSLHLTIINSDGNIYDCISHLIANLFSGQLERNNEFSLNRYMKLKRNVSTSTFCIIGDKLILDPTNDEVSICNFYFSIIKYGDEDYLFHKIKGDSAHWAILQEAFRLS
jgi:exosome complex RNA-binding protein Rrp42 (RNase PH superfamily)